MTQKNTDQELANQIIALIEISPVYYSEIAEKFSQYSFVTVAKTFGELHAQGILWQDPRGKMCLKNSKFAAKQPG